MPYSTYFNYICTTLNADLKNLTLFVSNNMCHTERSLTIPGLR